MMFGPNLSNFLKMFELTRFSTAHMCASLIASLWKAFAVRLPGMPPWQLELNELVKDVCVLKRLWKLLLPFWNSCWARAWRIILPACSNTVSLMSVHLI